MAFRLVKDPMEPQVLAIPISSLTVTLGELLELDIGATTWTAGDASTEHWQRKAVAIEAATSSATEVKAVLVHDQQLWEADLANASSANHNGDRMLLVSGGLTVNNTGTDNTSEEACFIQFAPVGAAADATALGFFVGGSGVNPDAA